MGVARSPIKRPSLDKLSRNEIQEYEFAHVPGRQPGDTGWWSGSGSRGWGLVTSAPGRLGQDTPVRHHDRSAGAISLDWDSKARVTPASDAGEAGCRLRVKMRCDALRLSNHRGGAPNEYPGSRVAHAERWRSVAAASAVVERREASAPRGVRCASEGMAVVEQRLSAFRFPFVFVVVIASREAAKQSRVGGTESGLLRRKCSSQ